ncbi:MAG: hypothetical protein Q8P20_10100 [bacterium]|nr:hypothetical protein [bacterium]
MALTEKDLKTLVDFIRSEIQETVRNEIKPIREDIHELQKTVDTYIKQTQDWHQEFIVVKARYDKMKEVIVRKGIATEKELQP